MGSFPFAATFCVSCAMRAGAVLHMMPAVPCTEFLPGGAGQSSYILQIWAITKIERDNKKKSAVPQFMPFFIHALFCNKPALASLFLGAL